MKNILHDLYYGYFSAWERGPIHTKEHQAVNRRIEDEKGYFMQKMSADDCQRFEVLENLYSQSSDCEQADAFSYGFRLATMLMCAAFMTENESQY